MRACSLQLSLLGGLAFFASACSWSRFDDITKNSPVVLLEKPGSMNGGFGVSLSTASHEGQTELLVGGTVNVSGAALYEIGQEGAPGTTAIDTDYCSGHGSICSLSSLTAGFANASGPDRTRPLCFAVGSGAVTTKQGLVMRCQDFTEYTLSMPQVAQDQLAASIAQDQPRDFPMATDRSDDPVLLASLPEKHLAWFYPAKSTEFSELLVPSGVDVADPSFGQSLAVLNVEGGRVLALGVPGKSRVLLWKTDGSAASSYIGCLAGASGMGRALAGGAFRIDTGDDLVVSDDSHVQWIEGTTLFALPETSSSECVLSGTIPGALIDWFDCGSTQNVAECEKSEFGAALAVGDLDGNGDNEVIVGAPKMTVNGKESAGALLVYDVNTLGVTLVDTKFISSAEAGDELGRSIVTPHVGKRDIIAAGAPGHGKAALFYCSSLPSSYADSARCR